MKVSEEEFYDFIDNHPRQLYYDICQLVDPPIKGYFVSGRPMTDGAVASIVMNRVVDENAENDYYITEDSK